MAEPEAVTGTSTEKRPGWWASVCAFKWNNVSKEQAVSAEKAVFGHSRADCTFRDTLVGDQPDETVHSISAGTSGPHVVCLPGYGAASGWYYRNVEELSKHVRLHLVDWLGTGLSGRPKFLCKTREESEAWFLDSLNEWRQQNGIDKMVLVGHSLGGYLCANYALKYPEQIQHVVLVCPAGISKMPPDWKAVHLKKLHADSAFSLRGQLVRVAETCWNWGLTPGSVTRTLGPWGRRLTNGYTNRRLYGSLGVPTQEALDFEPYLYQCLASRGSGEFALRHILAPFAWARLPMEDRSMDELKVPLTFIYGEDDWMDPAGAHRICERIAAGQEARPLGGNDCEVITIPKSGHFTFFEQPDVFNAHLLQTMKAYITGVEQQAHVSHVAVHLSGTQPHEDDLANAFEL